jgi:hypothetical protein
MRVRIDEARRYQHAARVDLFRAPGGDLSDGSDLAVADRHIGLERLAAGAVDDCPVADDQIRHSHNPNLSAMP